MLVSFDKVKLKVCENETETTKTEKLSQKVATRDQELFAPARFSSPPSPSQKGERGRAFVLILTLSFFSS